MGVIHGILDVVGCSPELIGMGANLINAALYAFVDHDYGMAALSLLAGVTFSAAKVVAMGGKFAKAAKTVETVGRFVSNVASFAICTKQAVDVGSAMWQKYYVEGKSLDGSSAMEFLTLGLNIAGIAMSGKGMVESGNKICKSIKESGVTNKISGKVKSWVDIDWNSNGGFVDPSAPIVIGGSNSAKLRNTKNIRYSQDSIKEVFDNKTKIKDLVYHLKNSPEYASSIEPIRLVRYNDLPNEVQKYLSKQGVSSSSVFTLDNRRLYAAKQAGVKVNSIWATQEDLNSIDLIRRFTTITGGKTIDIR